MKQTNLRKISLATESNYEKSILGVTTNPESSSLKIQQSEWFNSNEAAQYLKISTKQLLNLTSKGKIPYYKFFRLNRYKHRELNDLLLLNKRGII